MALVLLNTILFRMALRSPGAGGLPFDTGAPFFFNFSVPPPRVIGLLFFAWDEGPLFLVASSALDVEKGEALLMANWEGKSDDGRRGRHLQQLDDAILCILAPNCRSKKACWRVWELSVSAAVVCRLKKCEL